MLNQYKSMALVDKMGRITIPHKVRESMGIKPGEMLRLEYQDGIIQVYAVEITEKK